MPIMEIKILPLGTKTASVSDKIIPALKALDEEKDTSHQTTPMGTIVEGETIEQLFTVAGKMHRAALESSDRIVTFIELDDRKDKPLTMESKLQSVHGKLGGESRIKRFIHNLLSKGGYD